MPRDVIQLGWVNLNLDLSAMEWLLHSLIFIVNFILFFAAKPIVTWASGGEENISKTRIFKTINVLLLVMHGLDFVLVGAYPEYQRYFIRIGLSLTLIYVSLLLFGFLTQWARRRFGSRREVEGKTVYYDSYNSRLIEIVILVLNIFITAYCLILVWEADSLLETTGIFGILVAFLAFTSGTWAPDIISGLLILNSEMLEDGDLVCIDGYPDEYIINRVSFMYTTLFDVRNNHRTIIRNSHFTKTKIDNISRIASTDGVRQAISYNIGYPEIQGDTEEERFAELKSFRKGVDVMFEQAYKSCCLDSEIKINRNKEFEWSMTRAGDYALEYTLWFYLVRIPNTKVTATARKHLISTTYKINEAVYEASVIYDIDLSTPDLVNASLSRSLKAATPGF